MRSTRRQWDVLILGSGISSLTAAILLLRKGLSVCVIEKIEKPGGYMHSFNRFGFKFDSGTHYLGALHRHQAFWSILNYLDVYDSSHFTELNSEGFDRFTFPDFEFDFPSGYERVIDRFSTQFPEEALEIQNFFQNIRENALSFPTYEFSPEFEMKELLPLLETPLSAKIEGVFKNPNLKALLYAHCTLHGVHPKEVSIGLHSLMLDSFISGAWGMQKGGQLLANRFVRKIRSLGGEVLTDCEALEIHCDSNSNEVSEIITPLGAFKAQWVIAGIHPKILLSLLRGERLRPAFRKRIESYRESFGFMGLYGVCKPQGTLREKVDPLKNYYVFNSPHVDEWFDLENGLHSPHAAFLSIPTRKIEGDSRFPIVAHWPGKESWFAPWKSFPTGKRPEDYETLKRTAGERVIEILQKSQVWRTLGSEIEEIEVSTPLTNIAYNGSIGGSGYGIMHDISSTGIRSLGPKIQIPNLLLTGQNTLFVGFLGSAISGIRTAGAIIGVKNIINDLSKVQKGIRLS